MQNGEKGDLGEGISDEDERRFQGVPRTLQAAGSRACEAFLSYFETKLTNPGTRSSYRSVARRFFAWAEQKGVPLDEIQASHVEEYAGQFASDATRRQTLVALRGLFGHLARCEVVEANPLPSGPPRRAVRRLTLRRMKQILHDADPPIEEDSAEFRAGLVLLGGLFRGNQDLVKLSRFTEVSHDEVERMAMRLRAAGVWTPEGHTACCWAEQDGTGDVAFWLDVLVALGLVERLEGDRYRL